MPNPPIEAWLAGSRSHPHLCLHFGYNATFSDGRLIRDWISTFPDRHWDKTQQAWIITGTGPRPELVMRRHNITVDVHPDWNIRSLNELTVPWGRVDHQHPGTMRIAPRLYGATRLKELIGAGATWDPRRQCLTVPFADCVHARKALEVISFDDEALEAIRTAGLTAQAGQGGDEASRAHAALAAAATGIGDNKATDSLEHLVDVYGPLPDWWTMDLYPYQRLGAYAMIGGHRLNADMPGLGKCVTGDVLVSTGAGMVRMDELWAGRAHRGRIDDDGVGEVVDLHPGEVVVPSWDEVTGTSRMMEVSHLYRQWVDAPVKTIRTESGAVVTSTLPHKFLTPFGWTNQVNPGDMIAVPRQVALPETDPMADPLIGEFFGWLVGEGYEREPNMSISNKDPDVLARVSELVPHVMKTFGIPAKSKPCHVSWPGPNGECGEVTITCAALRNAFRDAGYRYGELSAGKRAPGFILTASTATRIAFLRALFDAEAHVSSAARTIEYSTASEGLAIDVQSMLAEHGIAMNVATRMKKATNGSGTLRPYRVGTITGSSVHTFAHLIGFSQEKKSDSLAECTRNAATSPKNDRIPIRSIMDPMISAGFTGSMLTGSEHAYSRECVGPEIARELGRSLRRLRDGSMLADVLKAPRHRWTTQTLTAIRGCSELQMSEWEASHRLATSPNIRWTRVVEVTHRPHHGWVYDLTVPATHNYIANNLWCHNTRQGLAAAVLAGSDRTLIICPPVVVTSWAKEYVKTGTPWADTVRIVPGRKIPALPDKGLVVTTDELVKSRPELIGLLADWAPKAAIYDEAHRARTWDSARSLAVRTLAAALPASTTRFALTGTPIIRSVADIATPLAWTGQLEPVFGSFSNLAGTYCYEDNYGRLKTRKRSVQEFRRLMDDQVWVRRDKSEVLSELPPKQWFTRTLDVNLADYRAAHSEVAVKVDEWVMRWHRDRMNLLRSQGVDVTSCDPDRLWPSHQDALEWGSGNVRYVSSLRRAAGEAKVPAAIDYIDDWLHQHDGDDGEVPSLIVWGYHKSVMQALRAGISKRLGGDQKLVGVIDGATTHKDRDRLVEGFQAGVVKVLVCQIAAAGVGITLTRASNAVFVETDWIAELIEQAEDRCHRISQTRTCTYITFLADGTLDAHIHVQRNRTKDGNAAAVKVNWANVDRDEYLVSLDADRPAQILAAIAGDVIADRKAGRKPKRLPSPVELQETV